jgi:hypothetical protein
MVLAVNNKSRSIQKQKRHTFVVVVLQQEIIIAGQLISQTLLKLPNKTATKRKKKAILGEHNADVG